MTMFEIGKWYTVWLIEDGEEGWLAYKVADYQAPLLRLQNPNIGNDMIVNTSSPMFVRAQLSEHQGEPERLLVQFPDWVDEKPE